MIHWAWLIAAGLGGGLIIGLLSFALCSRSSRKEFEKEATHQYMEWLELKKFEEEFKENKDGHSMQL